MAERTETPAAESLFPALQVTGACNKDCTACLRPPELRRHRLSYEGFSAYLADLAVLARGRRLSYQFVTGGEPTIWRDGERDVTDLLAELTAIDAIGTIAMPTNGKLFEDRATARDFIARLARKLTRPIVVGVSVAGYQHNLDEGECAALENLLALREEAAGKVLPIALVTLAVEDETYELLCAAFPNLFKRVTALAPLGGAAEMREACPSLSLGSSDKSTLGAFWPHFRKDACAKLKLSEEELERMPNAEVINRLSSFCNCGRSPFVDDRWHFCLPFLHHEPFDLCDVGGMEAETIGRKIDAVPFVQAVRARGVVEAIRGALEHLEGEARERVEALFDPAITVSAAYRGCMVCRELHDRLAMEGPREA